MLYVNSSLGQRLDFYTLIAYSWYIDMQITDRTLALKLGLLSVESILMVLVTLTVLHLKHKFSGCLCTFSTI